MNKSLVKSLAEFVEEVEFLGRLSRQTIFRGQDRAGSLLPGIARGNPSVEGAIREHQMVDQMRLLGASLIPSSETKLDLLVRAQHFGLKTRLLDWTSNPLAALWFACTSRREGDVFVYALMTEDLLLAPPKYDDDPFAADSTRVFQPRLNNPRVIAQHGWFSLHSYSQQRRQFVALEDDPDIEGRLTEFRVPVEQRVIIISSLDLLGVNHRTLFPDLDGLCRYLNFKFMLPA